MAIRSEHKQKVQGGSEHVLYKGLLALAHEKWGTKWSLEAEWLGWEEEHAMTRATVTTPDGQKFSEIGDASKANTNKMIGVHLPRMSATRAKGRALRDALNIGEAMFEELGGEETEAKPAQAQRSENRPRSESKAPSGGQAGEKHKSQPRDAQVHLSDGGLSIRNAQQARIKNLVGQLVTSDEPADTEKALNALEEEVGHPLESWTKAEAEKQIGRLQKALDNRQSKA